MGFFGDLKQDLSHAVNELLPDDKSSAADRSEEASADSAVAESNEYDRLLEEALNEAAPADNTQAYAAETDATADYESQIISAASDIITDNSTSEAESAVDSVFADMEAAALSAAEPEPAPEPAVSYENTVNNYDYNKGADFKMDSNVNYSEETSVITLGMTVNGDISTEGSLEILGNVKGNIDVTGKLNITGHVNGNSKAHEVFAENAKITGDITSESSIKIGAGTVIIGNLTGFSAAVAGAVKGDIDVHGPVILDSSAIVMGNIRSKSVQINNGAAIEGNCSQCYADVSPTSFFDEYKPEVIGKKGKGEKADK